MVGQAEHDANTVLNREGADRAWSWPQATTYYSFAASTVLDKHDDTTCRPAVIGYSAAWQSVSLLQLDMLGHDAHRYTPCKAGHCVA